MISCETVHLAHILTLTLILHMLYLGFVKNGIALLRTSNCLLWRNWSAILGLWDYRSTFSTFSGMADGGFCDFPPGVDSSIIAQMFHERAAAQSFGKTVHS